MMRAINHRAGSARCGGFTLIELLVAMFITAILFVLGYRSLDQAMRSRHALDDQANRLHEVQLAMRAIEQDFELLQPRPVRNGLGDGYLPALVTPQNAQGLSAALTLVTDNQLAPLVTFTRAGWTNPAGLPRGELQRVSYALDKDVLVRSFMPTLDSTATQVPTNRKLLQHVKRFEVRFLDASGTWQKQWPATTTSAPVSAAAASAGATPGAVSVDPLLPLRQLPTGVQVLIELDDLGVIIRNLEVPG